MKRCLFRDLKNLSPLDFVLPGLIAGTIGLIVGRGAIGKTFLALQIAISLVLRRAIAEVEGVVGGAGALWPAQKSGPVLVVLGEDMPIVIQHRMDALREGMRLSDSDLELLDENLEIMSATDLGDDLRLVKKDQGGNVERGPFFDLLIELCRGRRIVIIDPLALLAAGINENDNGQMTQFMRILAAVATETGCAILVLHHSGKTGSGSGEDWEKSRGASAITTSVRLQINLSPPSQDDMTQLAISEEDAGYWIRVAQVKSNYAAPKPAVWLRRGKRGVLHSYPEFARPDQDPERQQNSYAAARDGLQPARAEIPMKSRRTRKGGRNGPF